MAEGEASSSGDRGAADGPGHCARCPVPAPSATAAASVTEVCCGDQPTAVVGPRPASRVNFKSATAPELRPPTSEDRESTTSPDGSPRALLSDATAPSSEENNDDEDDEEALQTPLAMKLASRKAGLSLHLDVPAVHTMSLERAESGRSICESVEGPLTGRSLDACSVDSRASANYRGCLQKSAGGNRVRKSASVQFGLDLGRPTKVVFLQYEETEAYAKRAAKQEQPAAAPAPASRGHWLKLVLLGCFAQARSICDEDHTAGLASDSG